jgi:hypothetical protein
MIRAWSLLALILGGLLSTPSAAQQSADIVVFKLSSDHTVGSASAGDILREGLRSPVFGPLIMSSAASLGIPPQAVAAAAVLAPPTTTPNGDEQTVSFPMPQGYQVCGIHLTNYSNTPQTGRGMPFMRISSNVNALQIFTRVHGKGTFQGRSFSDVWLDVTAVRSDRAGNYQGRCADSRPDVELIQCLGRGCRPHQGSAFLIGR